MYHIKLARDRRRKKLRTKVAIFFFAILSILIGITLSLKNKVVTENVTALTSSDQQNLHNVSLDKDVIKHPASTQHGEFIDVQDKDMKILVDNTNESTLTKTNKVSVENEKTETDLSYDDLDGQDDEVDQVNLEDSEMSSLPDDAKDALNSLLDVADQAMRIKDQFTHTIVNGDTLKDVLENSGLGEETSNKLLADYPELKKLKAGQQIYWILDNDGNLEYLNWLISAREERIYERIDENNFKRQILEKKSVWRKDVLKGQINGAFSASLKTLGLNKKQINQLTTALQWQVSINKLKKGDKFAVLVSREYLDDKLTGQGNVEAIHIVSGGKSYYAIQASNGRYYNRQGETLGKGFARSPLLHQARISSHFNPARRHPVTGRIRPHKGVDFAIPVGTPIIAPADGIVEKVAYQANGAGRYIMIRHGREYQTVYMHLSRSLVKAGQSVKRGQRIALSGNTGRSTGAHLHYEFHINGRPVNPLKVKLPGTSSQMASSERKAFLVKAKTIEKMLKI
ncbi:murein DD-endopeptidase MepM [Canicola haemoglobinophilus]|uniref:murein DD-endopeptidase MepM n=1 Tax=Canicola haemoglobinophilus TaxID=733 RepID=UPI0009C6460B|nr:murein DD-endopeptidase MepM [Canicola haemoglobinophilus]OOS01853.1 murein DD-endopeptidase MepM [Canicola haemoglobinophilus]